MVRVIRRVKLRTLERVRERAVARVGLDEKVMLMVRVLINVKVMIAVSKTAKVCHAVVGVIEGGVHDVVGEMVVV